MTNIIKNIYILIGGPIPNKKMRNLLIRNINQKIRTLFRDGFESIIRRRIRPKIRIHSGKIKLPLKRISK